MSGYGGARGDGGARWNDETQSWERPGGPAARGPAPGGPSGGPAPVTRGAGTPVVPPSGPVAPPGAPGPVPPPGLPPVPPHAPVYVPETGEWRPPAPGSSPEGRPRVRTGLVVGAAAAVLVVGSVGGRLMWGGDDGPAPAAGSGTTVTESESEWTSEPGPVSGGGTGTEDPTAGPPTGPAPRSGFRVVEDPGGFTLAVPEGWDRTTSGQSVFYNAPDGRRLIQVYVVTEPGLTPYEALRAVSDDGRAHKNGYREVLLERVSGDPAAPADAAELVYAYTREDGSRRKVADRAFTAEDGVQYAILAAGPEGEWPSQRELLLDVLESFRPGTP